MLETIQTVMRDVFGDDSIVITKDTTADDIDEWDSMNNVRLIVALEQELNIRLPLKEINGLKSVGDLQRLLEAQTGN